MADDFDIDAVIAQHGRRGKQSAPAADDFDIDAAIKTTPADAGPAARRIAAGKAPTPAVPADDGGSLDLRDVERERRMTEGNPFAGDPLAAGIVTGIVGAGLGTLAGAAAAGAGAGPVVTAGTTGAVGGASSAALSGADAKGIVAGGILGGGLAALSPIMAGAAKRVSERTYQEYAKAAAGAGKGKTLAKLEAMDAEEVADVLHRNEIGSIKDGAGARAATQAAIAKTGQQMGNAIDLIDAAPGAVTLGEAMGKLEGLRKSLAASETTRPMADQLFKYMRDFWEANGAKQGAPLTAKALHGKVSDLQAVGYSGSGAELSPVAAKTLARQTAGALDDLLDARIAAAAKANPAAAEAAKHLETLTKDYRVLKTIEPITKARATAERFAPTFGQKVTDALAHPVKSAAKVVVGVPVRAVGAIAGAADRALAALYVAPKATPDLIRAALDSGAAPATVAGIVRQKNGTQPPPFAPIPVPQ